MRSQPFNVITLVFIACTQLTCRTQWILNAKLFRRWMGAKWKRKRKKQLEKQQLSRAAYNCVRYRFQQSLRSQPTRPSTYGTRLLHTNNKNEIHLDCISSVAIDEVQAAVTDAAARRERATQRRRHTQKRTQTEPRKVYAANKKLIALCTSIFHSASTWHSVSILCVHFFPPSFTTPFFRRRRSLDSVAVTTQRKTFWFVFFSPTS